MNNNNNGDKKYESILLDTDTQFAFFDGSRLERGSVSFGTIKAENHRDALLKIFDDVSGENLCDGYDGGLMEDFLYEYYEDDVIKKLLNISGHNCVNKNMLYDVEVNMKKFLESLNDKEKEHFEDLKCKFINKMDYNHPSYHKFKRIGKEGKYMPLSTIMIF